MKGIIHQLGWVLICLGFCLGEHSVLCRGWEFISDHPIEFFGASSPTLNGSLYILGNNYNNEYAQEIATFERIWILDGDSLQWRWRTTSGDIPIRRRYYCTSVSDNKIYMFGGRTEPYDSFTNEMYSLDLISYKWTSVRYKSIEQPSVVAYMSCNLFQGKIYVFGGYSGYFGMVNLEFWSFEIASKKWAFLNPSALEMVNYPNVYNPNAGLYQDSLFMCSGSTAYYNPDGYYDNSPTMWIYNITKGTWETPVEMKGVIRSLFTTTLVYENKMHIFGGMVDGYWTQQSDDITIVNLDTFKLEEVQRNEFQGIISYPIEYPFPRALSSSFVHKGRWIITGGGYLRAHNDIWIFDLETRLWTENSLDKYPLGRRNPHATVMSKTEIIIFGGLICPLNPQPINDLWVLDTHVSKKWRRLVQESDCHPSESSCAPSVIDAAFGYWNKTIFLIGGYIEDFTEPIMKQFSMDLMKWSNIVADSSIFLDVGIRYYASAMFLKNKLMVWGGSQSDGGYVTTDMVVLDLENFTGVNVSNTTNSPLLRKEAKFISIDGKFCFYDQLKSESPDYSREVWCYIEEKMEWRNITSLPKDISDNSITVFDSNVISFGGTEQRLWNEMWMGNLKSSNWGTVTVFNQMIPQTAFASTIIQSNILYAFGGNRGSIRSNKLYILDLSQFWCAGVRYIIGKNEIITDGSEQYLYFPGTNCSWVISNSNFLVIDYVNVTMGATLKLRQQDNCGEKILYNKERKTEISLIGKDAGEVIEVLPGNFIISFVVERDAETSDGFSIRLFDCNLGYAARASGCFCESNKYINFRGECVACPEGYSQELENQYECAPGSSILKDTANINDLNDIQQSEMTELSFGLPPVVHGNAFIIHQVIYLIGGTSSPDTEETQYYYEMGVVYHTKLSGISDWTKSKAKGDIPSRRVHSCVVSLGDLAVLIGGKTVVPDDFIYSFNSTSKLWRRKLKLPTTIIGAQCAEKDSLIYIFGGQKVDGEQIENLLIYNHETDSYNTRNIQREISRSFGSLIFYKNKAILFGGITQGDESESLIILNQELEFENKMALELQKCTPCDEEGGTCFFGRKDFSFFVHGDELHVFGGSRKGDTLADITIVNLNSTEVLFHQNFGLTLPELPLTFPPPKYGATHVSHNSKLFIIGGATSANNVVNDIWVWDAALKTWIDTSILREPINRKEPGFVKLDEKTFVIFGGSTQYFNEVLLNDLWLFNIENSMWTPLFFGSLLVGPQPRAGAMMSFIDSKVYVLGGRTSLGVFDEQIWAFDLGSMKWEVKKIENHLYAFQRPLNRYGIRSTQIGSETWMWGGQILPGSKKVEFYSAVVEMRESSISSNKIPGKTPPRRTYHSLCAIDNSNITMYGGYGFDGKPLNDMWTYNTDTQLWTDVQYSSSSQSPYLSEHTCSEFDGFTILSGIDITAKASSYLMVQHRFRSQTTAHIDNIVNGYDLVTNHAGGMMNGLVVNFGGTNGFSTTNQVIAYRPGLCSSRPKIVMSLDTTSIFDDGSGSGMYLESSNCTWILPNATHIIVEKDIRKQDRLEVLYLVDMAHVQGSTIISKSDGTNEDVYYSPSGFIVRFYSATTSEYSKNKPCLDCHGFSIRHATCSLNGYMNAISKGCECNKGYILEKGECTKDTMSNRSDYVGIVGGVVGGLLVIGIVVGLIYRKRIIEKMEGAEKKLYGVLDPAEISFGRLLGSGSFGEVFKGEWRGTDVAIKVLLRKNLKTEQINAFKREIAIMVELRHPNIVLYMGACFAEENLCLVCELMHQGSLYDVLRQDMAIPYAQRIQFMSDISKGMQYLHMSNPPIIHRDLKSLNVLADDRFRLKVSDFGLTTIQGSQSNEENTGSLLWLAPEVIGGAEYKACADVYSFGIIAWEIISRKDPYSEVDSIFAVTTQVIMNGLRPTMPPNTPPEIQTLIKELWAQNPDDRPTFQEASKKITILAESSKTASSSSFSISNESRAEVLDSPPEGNICVVSAQVFDSEKLWEDIPESMGEATIIFNQLVKQASKKYHGYISQGDGVNYVVVFQEILQAIKFCSDIQVRLMESEWPGEILAHESGRPVANGELNGLRVHMGIDFGTCSSRLVEETKRRQFTGKIVSSALRLSRASLGGQILITCVAYQALEERVKVVENGSFVRPISISKGNENVIVYEICPKILSKRAQYFSILSPSQAMTASPDTSQHPNVPSSGSQNEVPASSSQMHIHQAKLLQDGGLSNQNKNNIEIDPDKAREKKGWEISFDELALQNESIGTGSYGSVFIATWKGRKVAVKKIISDVRSSHDSYIAFFAEVSIYRKLKHPNIVDFVGACIDISNLAIIMELVENGNLRQLLHNNSILIGEREKLKIVDGIIQGMTYLHSLNPVILHRDLKSANVLVSDDFVSKICDFGFARLKVSNRTMTKCGTVAYQAPEIMKGKRYGEKADVYSFGILLWEIESREVPYRGKDTLRLQFEVINGLRPEISASMNASRVALMQKCWSENPDSRPSFKELANRGNAPHNIVIDMNSDT